jgi:hypothetical protein
MDPNSPSTRTLIDAALSRLKSGECAELEERIRRIMMSYGLNRLPEDYPAACEVFITSDALQTLSYIISQGMATRSAYEAQQVLACFLTVGIQVGFEAAKTEKGTEKK